jgi:hypothetical protein
MAHSRPYQAFQARDGKADHGIPEEDCGVKHGLFIMLNGLAIFSAGACALAAIVCIVSVLFNMTGICSLIRDCASDRAILGETGNIGTYTGGGFLILLAIPVYGLLTLMYWGVSSFAAFRDVFLWRKILLVSAVVVPSVISILGILVGWPDYTLVTLFISIPLISLFAFKMHWPLLLWLKQKMIDDGLHGEMQCQN